MGKESVSVRIDSNLKREAEELFGYLGMNMTTALTVFLSQAVRQQKIPFEIGIQTPNNETIEAIKEVEVMKQNPNNYKSYDSVDDMMEDLLG
ncbi:MAG: type II toxin-antitoxin system RelB/DinJ family antitoxin [Lachnospirales bacterium]